MVKRYSPYTEYDRVAEVDFATMGPEPDGEYVAATEFFALATDYAALESERDALARRINPDGAPVDVAALCLEIDTATDERDEWKRRCNQMTYKLGNSPLPTEDGWRKWYQNMYASLKAISEGRDNG